MVEDNPDDVELALHACRISHIASDVMVTRDGEEALEYLFCVGRYLDRASNDLPALMVLDLHLPGIGGLEVLRSLRQRPETRRIPVVILTSSDEIKDVAEGYDLGVNSYIRKPVQFEDFTKIMRQLQQYWLVTNTAPPM
ncbi:MAG: response regulator [Phaeospirillum sp.]|nr:response regulator [Phaeospirillum sp.]